MSSKLHRLATSLSSLPGAHYAYCKDLLVTSTQSSIRFQQEPRPLPNDHKLFDEMLVPEVVAALVNKDVVAATASIGRFAKQGKHREAADLFSRMLSLNIRPNEFTFSTIFPSLTSVGDLELGRQLHACSTKMGLRGVVFVGSALLDLYVKLGSLREAGCAFDDIVEPNVVSYTTMINGCLKKGCLELGLGLFRRMPEKNVVSWNAVITGCNQMGLNEMAVNLFVEMLREGFVPSESTFPSVIAAAANVGALGLGRSFHACATKLLDYVNEFAGNSLISFYAKCGSMEDSLLVFDELHEKTVVSWNAVICGFAQNGRGEEAVAFYKKMKTAGLKHTHVTLLGLLWACNHAGLVDQGYSYFNQAKLENPALLMPEHYACMVDLLSRGGNFEEAQQFLHDLPFEPGIGIWKALLGGCQIHSNTELGELAARKIFALAPEDVSSYVMLSNAYSAAGRRSEVSVVRREIKEKGMRIVSGSSWIETNGKVHVFMTHDNLHPRKLEIYSILHTFYRPFKKRESFHLLVKPITKFVNPRARPRRTPASSGTVLPVTLRTGEDDG